MYRLLFSVLLFSSAALAEPPRAVPPLPPPPPVISNKPALVTPPAGVLDRSPRAPGAWERIQDSMDRSTGRITDESLYETERLQRLRDVRNGQAIPQREFDQFQAERERRLRIEQQARDQNFNEQQIQQELDRREYDLYLNSAISPAASQAAVDEKALRDAAVQRDTQILAADEARTNALRAHLANAAQIQAEYQQKTEEIRKNYDSTRQRILGFPPSTMPATNPSSR